MSVFGIDYAWGRPSVGALKSAGVQFVARYLSHDTSGKNLDPAEAKRLSDAGIALVVVWETTARRALDGRAAGAQDARDADAQAKSCGMPSGRAIYFAVDFDAAAGQEGAISAYLDGAASVLGHARVGIYGSYSAVGHAFDGGHAAYGWQTYAWSVGHWDSRAQLRQYSNSHRVGGVDCDYNTAVHADFGQWRVGAKPGPVPPPSSAPPFPGRLLRQPPVMAGNDVKTWQQQMAARGWTITADGAYGPASEQVCRKFQADKGLGVDGIVGRDTWAASWSAPVT